MNRGGSWKIDRVNHTGISGIAYGEPFDEALLGSGKSVLKVLTRPVQQSVHWSVKHDLRSLVQDERKDVEGECEFDRSVDLHFCTGDRDVRRMSRRHRA
jgi:hypothetical protein